MKTTDIIRAVLDLLDRMGDNEDPRDFQPEQGETEASRFKQIFSMLDNPMIDAPYSNTPNEVVAPCDSVTVDAGGGVNGPKHPDDIRVKDPRGY